MPYTYCNFKLVGGLKPHVATSAPPTAFSILVFFFFFCPPLCLVSTFHSVNTGRSSDSRSSKQWNYWLIPYFNILTSVLVRLSDRFVMASAAVNKIERAHQMYREGRYSEALGFYTEALALAKTKPQMIALHSNRAACFLKLHDFNKVLLSFFHSFYWIWSFFIPSFFPGMNRVIVPKILNLVCTYRVIENIYGFASDSMSCAVKKKLDELRFKFESPRLLTEKKGPFVCSWSLNCFSRQKYVYLRRNSKKLRLKKLNCKKGSYANLSWREYLSLKLALLETIKFVA